MKGVMYQFTLTLPLLCACLVTDSSGQNLDFRPVQRTTGLTLNAVEAGASRFVAVGNAGRTLRSSILQPNVAGLTWEERTTTPALNLRAIEFDNTRFIAAGVNSVLFTSTDAAAWASSGIPPFSSELRGLAFNSGT